ncbi:MAG: acyltransferase, partial [Planctomycetota bacterium]
WINPDVIIGGGQKELGSLRAGDFLHIGVRGFINIADEVTIGDEVGLGVETKLYTHGGYLSVINGFPFQRGPIKIGSNVWLPNAMVLPNVKIGSNVVVAAMSLVNKDLPNGCLAGGVPAKVIEADKYPKRKSHPHSTIVEKTKFYFNDMSIEGPVTEAAEDYRDKLRRQGIRFRYYDKGGMYAPWD